MNVQAQSSRQPGHLMGRQGGVSPRRVLSDRDMNFSGTMARRSVFSCSSSVVMTSGHVRGAKGAWACVFRAQIDATNPSERGPALLAVQSRRGPTVTGLASGREANNGCMSSQRFLRVLLSGDGPCRGNFAVSLCISNILTVHVVTVDGMDGRAPTARPASEPPCGGTAKGTRALRAHCFSACSMPVLGSLDAELWCVGSS